MSGSKSAGTWSRSKGPRFTDRTVWTRLDGAIVREVGGYWSITKGFKEGEVSNLEVEGMKHGKGCMNRAARTAVFKSHKAARDWLDANYPI